jgi:HlyD family secretion protein
VKTWIKITIPVAFLLIVLGFIGWRVAVGNIAKPVKTITASYQTVLKDVAFTGNTESIQASDMAFELSGSVKSIYVKVGDTVVKGQLLATLDPQSASLQIAKAQADKANAAAVAYTTWQNALQTQKDTTSDNTKIIAAKKQAVRDANTALQQASNVYAQKQSETQSQDYATLAVQTGVVANQAAYNAAQQALTSATSGIKTSNDTAQHAVDAHAQYVGTQQAAINTIGISSLDALTKLAQITAAKSILRAPFSGVVTQKNIEVGEFAGAGSPIITIAQTSDLEINADVPETDALTLKQAMHASVTFDALSSDTPIDATVSQIYPAAKAIQGVPTFHVVLTLDNQQADLRSGITANITVHADKKDHVIAVPRRVITKKSGKTYVTIQDSSAKNHDTEVTTGLVGSDGLEEITSGIKEGDVIVSP